MERDTPATSPASMDEARHHRLAKTFQLLDKLLSLEKPMITAKMVQFLKQRDILACFLSYLHMLRPGPFGMNPQKLSRHEFLSRKEEHLKFSFRVAELITNPNEPFADLLEHQATFVVEELLRCFDDASTGSFQHFRKCYVYMLQNHRESVMQALSQTQGLLKLAAYLDEPVVAECLLLTFANNENDACAKCLLLDAVRESGFMTEVVCRIISDHHRTSDTAMEFFIQFVDLCLRDDTLCLIFRELATHDMLFSLLLETTLGRHLPERASFNGVQQKNAAECILQILRRGAAAWELLQDPSIPTSSLSLSARIQGEVYAVWSSMVSEWVRPVCQYMQQIGRVQDHGKLRLSAYDVEKPFTSVRLALIELLNEFVHCQTATLDMIPTETWQALCNWFFRYRFNNLYLVRFANLLEMAILENHVRTLRTVLSRMKFLTGMIKHFEEIEKTDARGCIVELCNMLRLKAESLPPQSFLRSFLVGHGPWRTSFLSTLKTESLLHAKKMFPVTHNRHLQKPYLAAVEDSDEGIELGSTLASKMGLHGVTPFVNDGKRKRRLHVQKNSKAVFAKSNQSDASVIELPQLLLEDELVPVPGADPAFTEVAAEVLQENVATALPKMMNLSTTIPAAAAGGFNRLSVGSVAGGGVPSLRSPRSLGNDITNI